MKTFPTKKSNVDFGNSSTVLDVQMTDRKSEFDHFNWNILQQAVNHSIPIKERRKFAKIYSSNHLEAIDKFGNSEPEEFLSENELEQLVDSSDSTQKEYPSWCQPHKGPIHLRQEVLLHFPYDSFDELLEAIASQADNLRKVTLTIYRLSKRSLVIKLIAFLLHVGVNIDVIIEPNARGNESDNIIFAHQLKLMGAKVIIGKSSNKIHAKFIHLLWKDNGMTSIIMTGNLNEVTARCYEDYCMITSNPRITNALERLIKDLPCGFTGNKPFTDVVCFTKVNAVSMLFYQINKEIEKGEDGYICIKCNSITDPVVISLLEYASQCGCAMDIICRGECCWKPALNDRVHVHRFIHQYLEHSRVYVFGCEDPIVYLGSLDLATHKLFYRFELLCRVLENDHIRSILSTLQNMIGDDTERHYDLLSDGNRHWYQMRGST